MYLFRSCRDFLRSAAIHDGYLLSAETLCGSCGIHGHVAGTDNSHALAHLDGCGHLALLICLHKVDTGQKLVCGIYTEKVLSGDAQEIRKSRTCTEENRLKTSVKQIVYRNRTADDHVGLDRYAEIRDVLDLFCHQCLRETELRNTVGKHTARLVQCLKDGHIIAALCKLACTGDTCRTRAYHCDLMAVLFYLDIGLHALCHMIICHKALQTADGYRLTLDTAHALALALVLLRAHTAADCGKRILARDDLVGLVKIPCTDGLDKAGDRHIHRASLCTGLILTVQAARSLFHRHILGVSERYLIKVFISYIRLLLTHGNLCHTHIRHCSFLQSQILKPVQASNYIRVPLP